MRFKNQFKYRPEIDGLRAVAVLAVVLYHAKMGCPGGYVGVDVFFVISGFLITSLLWRDLEADRFSFTDFWERRTRRIVPALVLVTLVTLLAGYFLLLPSDLKMLGKAAEAQAFFLANIRYYREVGYFSSDAEEKPLLHIWSLAVEEQFYLLIPVVLWWLFSVGHLRSKTTAGLTLVFVALSSFVISVYSASHHPAAAFYLLPSRAWELLLGSIVAFFPYRPLKKGCRFARESIGLAAMGMIFVSVFAFSVSTTFPGSAALLPCLGAALFIWVNEPIHGMRATMVGRILSHRVIVFFGAISYSFYLWHWPLLAFGKYVYYGPLPFQFRLTMVCLAFLLAIASWRFVEEPFRTRRFGIDSGTMFRVGAVGFAVVFLLGLLYAKTRGLPGRLSFQALEFAKASEDGMFRDQITIEDVKAGKLVPIGLAEPRHKPTVLVWGDSHAMAVLPAVDIFLKEKGLVGRAATHSSTAPVLNWFVMSRFGLGVESVAYNNSVLSYIQEQKVSDVLLVGFWTSYQKYDKCPGSFNVALIETIAKLVESGCQPWVLLDVPVHAFDVPRALAMPLNFFDYKPFRAQPSRVSELESYDPNILQKIKDMGGKVLDPKPAFLDSSGERYLIEANNFALYRDDHHLTAKGAEFAILPLLRGLMDIGIKSSREP